MRKNISIIAILMLSIIFTACGSHAKSLTTKQINDLRDEYPICSTETTLASFSPISLDDCIDYYHSFAYVKILSNAELIELKASDIGVEDVYWRDTVDFFKYDVEIISDTKGILHSKDKIQIMNMAALIDVWGNLKPGQSLVIPIEIVEGWPNNTYRFDLRGSFYIVDGNYGITTFDNKEIKSKLADELNGTTLDYIISRIKEIEEKQ